MNRYPKQYCYLIEEIKEEDIQNILENGTFLMNYPIVVLGIQTSPGVQFTINNSDSLITIGKTGIYELDLREVEGRIYSIKFNRNSLENINQEYAWPGDNVIASPFGLLIDTIYEQGG